MQGVDSTVAEPNDINGSEDTQDDSLMLEISLH